MIDVRSKTLEKEAVADLTIGLNTCEYLYILGLRMVERYLSTSEFAKIMGVSRVTVIKWIKSGRIRAYNVHGKWRIPASEVERLLRQGG